MKKKNDQLHENQIFVKAIDNGNTDIVQLIAINRLIDYIKDGKITFENSYYFQNIGERLRNIDLKRYTPQLCCDWDKPHENSNLSRTR